jgi:hypothetical protein
LWLDTLQIATVKSGANSGEIANKRFQSVKLV